MFTATYIEKQILVPLTERACSGDGALEGACRDAVTLINALRAELNEVREGYHTLDSNWEKHNNACLDAIRMALDMPGANVPEMCARINTLRGGK